MFYSRAQQGRRAAAKKRSPRDRRLSRQFAVEAMEGRLMLAASALDFTPVDLQPVSMVAPNVLDLGAIYGIAAAPTKTEGGNVPAYLSYDLSANALSSNGAGVLSRQEVFDLVTSWRQNNGVSANGIPGVSPGGLKSEIDIISETDSDGTIFGGTNLVEFTTNAVDGGGIRAVNFQDTRGVTDTLSTLGSFESYVVPESRSVASSAEGGPISIKAILTQPKLELVQQFEPASRVPSVAAQLAPERQQGTALAASSTDNATISAEWARAMVLETAGGELEATAKSHSGNTSQKSDVQPASHNGEPLSYITPIRTTVPISTGATDGSGALPASSAYLEPVAAVGDWHVPMPGETASHAGDLGYALVSNRGASRADMSFAAERAARATLLVEAAAGMPGALDAAFDELGDASRPNSESLAADWLSRGLGAAPLLMVLALERVACRNSRQNRRDAAPVAIRRRKLTRPVTNI